MNTDSNTFRGRGWPMQTLVALLVIAATLPLGALLFWNESEQARDVETAATERVLQLAQHAAVQTDEYLGDTLQLLERLATRPAIRAMDAAACDPVFAEFPSYFPRLANLIAVDANGGGVCASGVLVPGADAYVHFPSTRAIAMGADHFIESPIFGVKTKRWISAATVAVRDEAGQRRGTLTIAIDLERLPLLHGESLSGRATVELVDQSGMRVAGTREAGALGTQVAQPLLAALQGERPGTLTLRSGEGNSTIAAVFPIRAAPWFAVAHLPLDSVIAPARARLYQGLGIASLLTVVIWIAASLLIRRMLRPLHDIAGVARAVAAGDTAARARVGGPREIASIGAGLNRMLDQRAQADALRAGEARYRSLFETSSDAIIGLGLDNRVIFANPAVEGLTGWRADELVGESLAVLQPAVLREPHLNAIRRFAFEPGATLRRRSMETRCLHRDGREIPVEVTFSSAEIDGTRVFVGFMRDITERHAALAGLRESEQRFRVMADSSPVLIWTADAVVREFYFNATWLAFTGQTLEQARDAGWYGGVHPDDAIAVQEVIDRANLRHEGCTLEYRRLRYDGEYRWVLDTSAPRFDEGGRFLGYVGTAVDIHDRVVAERDRRDLAEDELKRLHATLEARVAERTRSLEAANRELEAFSYSVSHDLRAPLRGISGFSQLLHEGYVQRLDDTGRNYLERVRTASAKMARLIDDLLNLSRIARQAIHRTDVDVSALAEDAVAELRQADPLRKIAVSITPGLKAHADPGLTRIVLANLLDNAWKFTSRTQGALVTVEPTTIDGRPGFTVRDNGAGFDSSYAEKLFAPFQRLRGESEFPGTGIGLAIVQRIVHRHGGGVHVEATPGKGASFSFTLGS